MRAHEQYPARGGFTLIELSIVLVIIGLIVGGVLAGQELIRSATLKSIVTDEQKYITAVNTFRTKYNELPGDMVDATNYWGTDPNGCPDWGPSSTPQTKTCNGSGNGLIESEGVTESIPQLFEGFRAWQQLADAGLIPGAYTGVPYSAGVPWSYMPGTNIPATRISNAGFGWMVYDANGQESIGTWNAQFGVQYLLLGAPDNSGKLFGGVLSPIDAMNIDSKIDDGQPSSGTVHSNQTYSYSGYPWCVTAPASVAIYDQSVKGPGCTLLFEVKSW